MSFMGGITDFLTGGANSQAEEALNQALQAYDGVNAPSVKDLTLPELQQFVQAGVLTPEQAVAALQQTNAYNNINVDPTARQASIDALTKLQSIGDNNGMDDTERAKLAQIQSQENQTLQSQRGSIMDQMDQRGIPSSLMGVQQQLAAAGQDAEQAHQDALTANADASTRALQALEASGSLGNTISQEQFSEQAQKAAAQNAIDQWNAANQTTVNLNNAAARTNANAANLSNAQNIANTNTQNANSRTAYNTNLPQQVYADQMAKANAIAGVHAAQSNQYTGVGQQNAAVAGGIANFLAPQPFTAQGAGSTMAGGGASAGGGAPAGAMPAAGGAGASMAGGSAGGGAGAGAAADAVMLAAHGGEVPGIPKMPGDSPKNDTQPALLSPGEIVIPRTAAHDPRTALSFIKHLHRQTAQSPIHPDDLKSLMHAMTSMRYGGMQHA